MQQLGLNEIRERFLKFFEGKEHIRLKSFPLIPANDKSLLLINSGMAPLKPYFTGQEVPPSKRVTTCQKCLRLTDVDNVGVTARHGTFFEMLGNFSFGDYFKEEIIPWAWEFLTEVMEIPAERLFPSVFQDDDEAFHIWNKKVGIPADRIFRMGRDDNFWEVGLGPCGPCSEIYFDRGEKYGCGKPGCTVGCDCDRYMEIWNLVFTQFNKNEDGSYGRLASTNIDTGMGLERIAAVMQDAGTMFDVDTIRAIRDEVCRIAGVKYKEDPRRDTSIIIITDHIRSVTFLTADGVLPSNEGRGYVLRRLLRRAVRHGKLLGINGAFLSELSNTVIAMSKDAYPELLEKQDYIRKVLTVEENRFYETLDQGLEILRGYIKSMREHMQKVLAGSDAFKLYDTYGFPFELMKEMLSEEGLDIDDGSFRDEMEQQRQRARQARGESTYMGAEETVYNQLDPSVHSEFLGYEAYKTEDAKIITLISENQIVDIAGEGAEVSIILDKTPFYAESGGQKGDAGIIKTASGSALITDCIKVAGGKFAHLGTVTTGSLSVNEIAAAEIDMEKRMSTARNHTATHLLQKALRDVLGSHVEQAGSYVSSDRLRFDFTHFAPLTREELQKVEEIVNNKIMEGIVVEICETGIEEARKRGAMALFGEKYGQTVRVVDIGGYSIELCGGAHLKNTAQAGTFKLLSESGVAAGVRRIEALTGRGALRYYRELDDKVYAVSSLIKATPDTVISRVKAFAEEARQMHHEIEKLNAKVAQGAVDEMIKDGQVIGGFTVVTGRADGMDMTGLRAMGDKIKDKMKSGVIILGGAKDGKASFVVMATDDAVKAGANAGGVVKAAAEACGGQGGGRANMAQAGTKDADKLPEALERAVEVAKAQLEK